MSAPKGPSAAEKEQARIDALPAQESKAPVYNTSTDAAGTGRSGTALLRPTSSGATETSSFGGKKQLLGS